MRSGRSLFPRFCAVAVLWAGSLLAGELQPAALLAPAGANGPQLAHYADRALVVAMEIDRDGARLQAYTLKDRPFRSAVAIPEPRPYEVGRALQVELRLIGPGGSTLTRRVDVGPLCLIHPPETPPHVEGDTILLHRDAFLFELPELPGFDRLEIAWHERNRGELTRRSLGGAKLDAARFVPAGGPFSYTDLAFAGPEVSESLTFDTAGEVTWPEDLGDPDLLHVYGDPAEGAERINIVIVPDGYTYAEKSVMRGHADAMVQHFRQKTPYAEHDRFINYTLVYAYSTESGTDECDCDVIVDTAMGTRFPDTGNPCGSSANRCLYYGGGCDTNGTNNILAAELRAPYQDETIVMVNTTRYGGCGGARAVYSAANAAATEVAVHELGHSLAGLADEYGGNSGCGNNASEINTSLKPGDGAWPEWIVELGPAWEGGQYYDRCIYRPQLNCEMRSLNQSFCAVCNQHWSLVIFGHPRVDPTAPLAGASPASPVAAFTDLPVPFSVQTRLASGSGVTNDIEWLVQGPADPEPVLVATGSSEQSLIFEETGTHTVTCRVTADTNFIKPVRYGPNIDEAVWVVDVELLAPPPEISAPGSAEPLTFTGSQSLGWEDGSPVGASAYHLYRGALADLPAGQYGDCTQPSLEINTAQVTGSPPVGQCWFYLVSGTNPAGEGPLGLSSGDLARLPATPCE